MLLPFILLLSALIHSNIALSQSQIPLSSPKAGTHTLSPLQKNAPQIFNALHSSMRQWGSSLKHNGMSFFPASIPNNTQLYHGTHSPERVTGTEWLAFEVEHAEAFARPRGPRRPPGEGGPGKGPGGRPPPGEDGPGYGPPPPLMGARDRKDESSETGFLHIYRTTRTLSNLLYVDGMSAGKTSMGTLDTQDIVLRNLSDPASDTITAPWSDRQRAVDLCALGKEHGIEGFIRMETGFELILCDFTDGLEFIDARSGPSYTRESHDEENHFVFEYIRGVSMRYQGITAGRVKLDYSHMISAFFYDVNLTNPDAEKAVLPRLPARDFDGIGSIRQNVLDAVEESREGESVDWQGVVDMIVTRYTDRLQYMAGNFSTAKTIRAEVSLLVSMFIDHDELDIPTSIERCSTHYLNAITPHTTQDFFIQEAILAVSHKICSTLFEIRDLLPASEKEGEAEGPFAKSKLLLQDLIKILDWSTWLECGKCAYDEVCFVAMWPMGQAEDHYHPGCRKTEQLNERGKGYWGMGGPGPRHAGKKEL